MSSTQTAYAPFIPGKWTRLTTEEAEEIVRPYYADYLTVRAELDAAGKYPYNASFAGRIAGIAPATSGTTPRDEETAIYLLQQLHTRAGERARLAAFIERGARQITADDLPESGVMRGTVAVVGEYSGDTGYREHAGVRVVRSRPCLPYLVALPKGKRTHGISLSIESGASVYFIPEGAAR